MIVAEDGIFATDSISMHPDVSFMFQYWERKIFQTFAPRRLDIDPLDFWEHISRVWILDVHDGKPYPLFVRLYGTEIIEKSGIDKTGKFLSEFQDDFYNTAGYKRIRKVIETKKPVWFRGSASNLRTNFVKDVESLVCPLSTMGTKVDMIFGYTLVDFSERRSVI